MRVNILLFYENWNFGEMEWEEYSTYICKLHHSHTLDKLLQHIEQYQYFLVVNPLNHASDPLVILPSVTRERILVILRRHLQDARVALCHLRKEV